MMFTKNVLLGSLGFATVLMVGNWSGAIAESNYKLLLIASEVEAQTKLKSSNDKYLTIEEVRRLAQEFEQDVIPAMRRSRQFGLGKRSQQLDAFVRDWSRVDPETAHFLGSWNKTVSSLMIYPSASKGRVCVVFILPAGREGGIDRVKAVISVASINNGYLQVNTGDLDNRFFDSGGFLIRNGNYLGFASIRQGKPNIYPIAAFSDPLIPITSLSLANTVQNQRVIQKFSAAGCTASLPSNNQTQTSVQKHPAEVVVSNFYTWYLNNSRHREILYQQKESFTPNFYRYLDRAIRITQANNQWSGMLNYDLFSFTQVGSYSFQITSVIPKENSTEVYLNLEVGLRRSRNLQPIKVIVIRNGNSWQIDNFYFLSDPSKNYNLLSELIKFNQVQMFQNVPWGNETIPSIPSSSTPVKPTDTIAKYPTNDDFNAFEDKLQGNPESLVKLRGNQAEQRRKFQNDWKDRNPNTAKFLGAWYTGDRYFYVFPSTVKGGTCVVTQDANGKLNMQVGTVLNKELRYGGGKGFFWRDRPNIIASRDSSSGSLYPIYATFGMPELTDSMIGDMERQKCITTLPFEADAQYYKERGDRFAKVGKKDEAIVNYRKAVDLYRKQNQLAQVRNIEAQIVKLGGTNTNASQSSPVSVYRNVKEFGFAQLIVGDRKLITAYETLVRASQDKYSIPVSINNIEFLKKTITTLRPIDCQQLGFSCSEKEITFSDYLELKQKIAKQKEVIEDSMNVANQFNIYGQRINNDTRYGGRNTVNQIAASTKKIWDEAQAKARTQSNLSFSEKVNIIAIQTKDDTLEFTGSVFKTSVKALATIYQIDEIDNSIRDISRAEAIKLSTNSLNYILSFQDSLKELKQSFLKADGEKIRDTTLKIIQSTLDYTNLQDNPIIGKSGNILKVYLSAKDFIDQDRLLQQPQLLNNLDDSEKFYLYAAQMSKGLEIAIAGVSIPLSTGKADSLLKIVDAANIILFDALEFYYKNDFRRRYARMLDAYNRNQFLIKGVQSYLDVISTEVGNYLINTRTDAVSRRQDGSVTVSTQGIIYPP